MKVTTVRIIGPSMEPALRNGEVYLAVSGVAVKAGDAVLMQHPQRREMLTVKRIVRAQGDGWWVEGDNSTHSTDSRHFGAISGDLVRGRVLFRVRPFRR